MTAAEAEETLRELAVATGALLGDVGGLSDRDVRGASLLPGWSRGHVLTHLARNAEGGVRLLRWARTGEPGYEYESLAARAAAIEAGAGRGAGELAEDVRVTSEALVAEAAAVPPEGWRRVVRWTAGQETEAALVLPSRLGEVLIHHVDLDIGYGPGGFVRDQLPRLVEHLGAREPAEPAVAIVGTDTGRAFVIGDGRRGTVSGAEAEVLGWLFGRSDGSGLGWGGEGELPGVPDIY
jgi:maleylpyruvate isomerase